MKSEFRYYLEYPTPKDKRQGTRKKPGNHCGTVLAVYTGREYSWVQGNNIMNECIGTTYDKPDSFCCSFACSWGYLRTRCKRISEAQAKMIHPNLFVYLNQ